ncbi:MAG: hypothetical protein P4L40_03880 [Terracidiphilus sp.]|nr:hypothetical protein [Terracidiphilus sp.]
MSFRVSPSLCVCVCVCRCVYCAKLNDIVHFIKLVAANTSNSTGINVYDPVKLSESASIPSTFL